VRKVSAALELKEYRGLRAHKGLQVRRVLSALELKGLKACRVPLAPEHRDLKVLSVPVPRGRRVRQVLRGRRVLAAADRKGTARRGLKERQAPKAHRDRREA
jgi:hypothetical protein